MDDTGRVWRWQEGSIFTDLELHVHSVSILGYSVFVGVGAAVAGVVLKRMLAPRMFQVATAATQGGVYSPCEAYAASAV
eukprot:4051404-Pyramimonas_sp.AAC.1